MKLAFDAKRFFHNRTGLGNYSRNLIQSLTRVCPMQTEFLLLGGNETHTISLPENCKQIPAGSLLWREWGIVKDIIRNSPDIYHGLSNELPFGNWPQNVKRVVTIHDILFRQFPEYYPYFDRKIYHLKTQHAVKVADKIIATSKATADDLIQEYGAKSQNIEIVYQTCGDEFIKKYPEHELKLLIDKFNINYKFILYVSSFQGRKNHLSLLKAIKSAPIDCMLVLAGRAGETLSDVKGFMAENGLLDRVQILTDVESNELPLLYRAAHGFIYPSKNEGFGIPLIEAAFAGCLIAVNEVPVFKEIAPEGSFYFSADDDASTARALTDIWNSERPDKWSGLEKFTPENSARNMLNVYESLML